jgi:hypothetical protein
MAEKIGFSITDLLDANNRIFLVFAALSDYALKIDNEYIFLRR